MLMDYYCGKRCGASVCGFFGRLRCLTGQKILLQIISMNSGEPVIVSAPLSACPGLRWCLVQVVRAVLVCVGFGLLILLIFIYLFYLLSIIYLLFIIYFIIYIILLLDTRLLLSIGAAGLLWRAACSAGNDGRGRAGRCADLCGVSGDARRADLWPFAAFRALASLSWWFAGGVLLWLACCGCRQSGRVLARCLIFYIII